MPLILNADDHEPSRYARSAFLRRGGYEVIEAATGSQAIESAVTRVPDVVLLDVHLPDTSGLEVCRALRSNPATSTVPILHISATAIQDSDAVRGLENGADGYLVDPVPPDILVATVGAMVRSRRSEQERLHALAQLETVIETSPAITIVLDPDGRILSFNGAAEASTGYSREEAIGTNIADMFAPAEWVAAGDEGLSPAGEATRDSHERAWRTKSGDVRWIDWRCAPIRREGYDRPCAVGSGIDVTDRRRAALAHRTFEARARCLVESNIIGVVVADEETIIEANDVFLRMVGYSREDLRDGRMRWREMTPREYVPADEEAVHNLRHFGACAAFEKEYFRKNGTRVPVLLGAALYSSNPVEWVCFVLDLSERKRAEREIREGNEALQRANEELNAFVYTVSHDLHEPLRSVVAFSELLRKRYTGRLDADADDYLNFVHDGGTRMQRMLTDLLSYSRIAGESEPGGAGFTEVSLDAALFGAIADLKSAIEESGAVITHDPLPTVVGQSSHLVHLFQNLIANAIKYRRGDEAPRVHVSAQEVDDGWRITVSDNGVGIDAKDHQMVFKPFRRLHRRNVAGTGLGLSICRKIVEAHGGRIWVESESGRGARFVFMIPRRAEETRTATG